MEIYNEKGHISTNTWVDPGFRGNHISSEMMDALEAKALERGFKRAILQTRPQMTEAVHLYTKRGYEQIENYPPYVEDETNGLLTYDRKVVKVHAQRMVQINRKLIESFEKATSGISEDT